MFDISPDDISLLNDIDLRELIGRLCEAEVVSKGFSSAAVTWGGSQTAADGGLDVRVELPEGAFIDGYIPRRSSGFQVKLPDMSRASILSEMLPKGKIRPAIQGLADESGAYVIVSAKGSTADSSLQNRRKALREALKDVDEGEQLYTDFFDRTRLATWVRSYPGLVIWVREKIGRSLSGWKPYGPWSSSAEDVDAEYLVDGKVRLRMGASYDDSPQTLVQAIDELRDVLATPGKVVRLVGLSGVGKTRLVQALFDSRIGSRALPSSLAIYTNHSDNPDPQPIGLVSDLIACGKRAVIVVDNCAFALHERLAELCGGAASTLSVLTVEYDIRDDQPEGTQVVTLDTSSPEVIIRLLKRRYSHLSQVDVLTISEVSGGNARIAIALAETVKHTDTIAGLSNEALFQRLFQQRHVQNDDLLHAAQALSLVYSFQGEALSGDEAELPKIASLVNLTSLDMYQHLSELVRRDLVQRRGPWRAVLPHAIANRLAARALDDIPFELINQVFIEGGTERLLRSFSRRLSYLHSHANAVQIATRLFSPQGMLEDLSNLNELGKAMFKNIAPVAPDATLSAIERALQNPQCPSVVDHIPLLRSLAYDPKLFERSARLLVLVAMQGPDERTIKLASETFISLFTIYLSGTHATVEQRLGLIEGMLFSPEKPLSSLGFSALKQMLRTGQFHSNRQFEFGVRSRDFGYRPKTQAEKVSWYREALLLLKRAAAFDEDVCQQSRSVLSRNLRALWNEVGVHDLLETLLREFAGNTFWLEGWASCRNILSLDKGHLPQLELVRISALERELSPKNTAEEIMATVLSNVYMDELDLDDCQSSGYEALEQRARELGALVISDIHVLREILPEIFCGGPRTMAFGRGLAAASSNVRDTWGELSQILEHVPQSKRDVRVMGGFLLELWIRDNDTAELLLDSVLESKTLLPHLPILQSALRLNDTGVERLMTALDLEPIQWDLYKNLAYGAAIDQLPGGLLKKLLVGVAEKAEGQEVALEIFRMRLFADQNAKREHDPEVLEAGRELLKRLQLNRDRKIDERHIVHVISSCLSGPDAAEAALDFSRLLRNAVSSRESYGFENSQILGALLKVQPRAVLDGVLGLDDEGSRPVIEAFDHLEENPLDEVTSEVLIEWCDQSRNSRYNLIAEIITFSEKPDVEEQPIWTDHAKALLLNSPDPQSVLAKFVERFRPSLFSGSLATKMESNVRLLDQLNGLISSNLELFVAQSKAQLIEEIAEERDWETRKHRVLDERFE